MLSLFRKMVTGIGAYIMIAMIVVVFAFVGVPALSNFGQGDAVKVGDQGVSVTQIDREYTRRLGQRAQAGDVVARGSAAGQAVLDEAVRYYIFRGLIEEEAEALGLAATDEMLQQYLRSLPVFSDEETGEFNPNLVTRVVQANGLSVAEFTDRLRIELLQRQLDDAVALGQPAPKVLADLLLLRALEERQLTFVSLDAAEPQEPDEAELQSFYAENIAQYRVPERRTFRYIALTPDTVSAMIEVDADEVRELYETRKDRLTTPATRSFTQARFDTMEAAQAAAAAIAAGTAFDEAVSGARITALEEVDKGGIADTSLADAIFAAEQTGVIGPVDGVFGPVLANVTSATPAETIPFDEVRDDFEAALREELAEEELYTLFDDIQAAGDAGQTLAAAAESLGIETIEVGPIDALGMSADNQRTNAPAELVTEAFASAPDGFFTEIDLTDGTGFIELVEVTPSTDRPFSEVADQVREDYLLEARSTALADMTTDLRGRINAGESFDELIAGKGVTPRTVTVSAGIPREDLPQFAVSAAFEATPNGIVAIGDRNTEQLFLVRVDDVKFTQNAQADMIATQLQGQLSQMFGSELYTAYITSIENEVGVKVNDAAIQARLGNNQ